MEAKFGTGPSRGRGGAGGGGGNVGAFSGPPPSRASDVGRSIFVGNVGVPSRNDSRHIWYCRLNCRSNFIAAVSNWVARSQRSISICWYVLTADELFRQW